MNTVEVLLILVGIPLAVIVVLALLTLPGGRKRTRYKPGQPWDHAPVWYEPHPEGGGSSGGHGPGPGSGAAAVGGGSTNALGSSMYPEQPEERNTDTGSGETSHGASAHGASSHGASAARPVNAGPLGGARGTW